MVPVAILIGSLAAIIGIAGAGAVNEYSMYALLGAGTVAAALALVRGVQPRQLCDGLRASARQMLPCLPLLALIATVSATWMLAGVVPFLVQTGVHVLSPKMFLATTCLSCALVSVLTGSSWTTIATMGVAMMGVGGAFGYNPAMTAGAIISGAYLGDKFSPLSDTTVIASGTTGVEIMTLIRHMARTTLPTFALTLGVFALLGVTHDGTTPTDSGAMLGALGKTFNLTPWVLAVPAVTVVLIALRVNTMWTLVGSTLAAVVAMIALQPGVMQQLGAEGVWSGLLAIGGSLLGATSLHTGHAVADSLASTGGIQGMVPTMLLVLSAMVFGGVMMGSRFLDTLTGGIARRLNKPHHAVSSTVATGVALNALTADQYVSIIINANIYRPVYRRNGLPDKLLARSVQDSVPVTSVLIPWNSCGVTQSAVLGVATLSYLPYCVFNILSPVMSVVYATVSHRLEVRRRRHQTTAEHTVPSAR